MDILTLKELLLWCTVLNVSVIIIWSVLFLVAPTALYQFSNRFFPISRENYSLVVYGILGLFKILVIIFNIVPYVALVITTTPLR